MFCCEQFQVLVNSFRKRGLSIAAAREKELRAFCIQMRTIEEEYVESLTNAVSKQTFSLTLTSDVAIQYCPFCGQSTKKTIENDLEKFDRLAAEHNFSFF